MKRSPWIGASLATLGIAMTSCLPLSTGPHGTPADYVDPTISNVAAFLRPTYPTVHQPN